MKMDHYQRRILGLAIAVDPVYVITPGYHLSRYTYYQE